MVVVVVVLSSVPVYEISVAPPHRWMDLRQIHTEYVFKLIEWVTDA